MSLIVLYERLPFSSNNNIIHYAFLLCSLSDQALLSSRINGKAIFPWSITDIPITMLIISEVLWIPLQAHIPTWLKELGFILSDMSNEVMVEYGARVKHFQLRFMNTCGWRNSTSPVLTQTVEDCSTKSFLFCSRESLLDVWIMRLNVKVVIELLIY